MHKNQIDLLDASFGRNIIRFSLPIIAMGFMQNLFVACDVATLGIFAGDAAVAAVGATTYLVNLFVNTFIGLSVGTNVIAAQAIGEGDEERVTKVVHTAITAGAAVGFLLLVLGELFSRTCLAYLDTPADILDQSALYLQIYFLAAPANLLFNFSSSILRASGNSRSPFVYITISGAANVFFNLFFIIVCDLGVAGVALGTILSQFLAAGLVLRHLMRKTGMLRFRPRRIGIDRRALWDILRVGVPTGINNMVFSISNTMIQSSINLFDTTAVAGCSASLTMESFVYSATNSIMQTAISFSGQNAGAGRYENMPKILKWCLFYTSVIGTSLGLLLAVFGRPILSLVLEEPAAIECAVERTWIVILPYMFCGAMEVFAGMLRGLGYSVLPTAVTLIMACGSRMLWVKTVFRATMSLNVLFLCFPLSWILTSAAQGLCYWSVMKRKGAGR